MSENQQFISNSSDELRKELEAKIDKKTDNRHFYAGLTLAFMLGGGLFTVGLSMINTINTKLEKLNELDKRTAVIETKIDNISDQKRGEP